MNFAGADPAVAARLRRAAAGQKKGGERIHRPGADRTRIGLQMACSLKHLSQSHIMPRTLPLVVIIFAACIGFPQHWGTLRLTMAFLVAAFAVLLISAMVVSPPWNIAKTCAL
jgi:hypothetical protein